MKYSGTYSHKMCVLCGREWKTMYGYGMLLLMTSANIVRSGNTVSIWCESLCNSIVGIIIFFTSIINDAKHLELAKNEKKHLAISSHINVGFDCLKHATVTQCLPEWPVPSSFLSIAACFFSIVVGARTERKKTNFMKTIKGHMNCVLLWFIVCIHIQWHARAYWRLNSVKWKWYAW